MTIDKIKLQGVYNLFRHKGALGFVMMQILRIKGKTVQIRHMSAIAVIGDKNCNMSLF
jgi:hypothetical protein